MSTLNFIAVGLIGALLLLAAAATASSRGWQIPGDASFWGSILGAIVGGSIALAGQWITICDLRQSREDEKAARDRAQGTAFLLKLVQIYNDLHFINRFFREAFDNDRARAPGVEPWTVYRPASYYPDPVRFSADELSVFVSVAPAELIARCLGIDERHNALLAGIAKIDESRTALVAALEPDSVAGNVVSGQVMLTARQRAEMNLINTLLAQSRAQCDEDLAEAGASLSEVGILFRNRLQTTITASPQ